MMNNKLRKGQRVRHVPSGRCGEYQRRDMWENFECVGAEVRFDGSDRDEQVTYAELEAVDE